MRKDENSQRICSDIVKAAKVFKIGFVIKVLLCVRVRFFLDVMSILHEVACMKGNGSVQHDNCHADADASTHVSLKMKSVFRTRNKY